MKQVSNNRNRDIEMYLESDVTKCSYLAAL